MAKLTKKQKSLAEKLAKQKERDEEAAKWTEKFSRSFKA